MTTTAPKPRATAEMPRHDINVDDGAVEPWLEAAWRQLWAKHEFSMTPRRLIDWTPPDHPPPPRPQTRGPRLVFYGIASDWGCAFLLALLRAGHDVAAIVTSARNPEVGAGPDTFTEIAARTGIPRLAFRRVSSPDAIAAIQQLEPDLIVVASFDQIFKPRLFELPRYGSINVHPSLLPRYRGPEPIFWTIANGDAEGGVSIHQIDRGVDTGPIHARRQFPVDPDDTAGVIARRSAWLGVEALLTTIAAIASGDAQPEIQGDTDASYCPPIAGHRLDWTASAARIERIVRAGAPDHPPTALLGDRIFAIRQATVAAPPALPSLTATPGAIDATDDAGLIVATGDGWIAIKRLVELTATGDPSEVDPAGLSGQFT